MRKRRRTGTCQCSSVNRNGFIASPGHVITNTARRKKKLRWNTVRCADYVSVRPSDRSKSTGNADKDDDGDNDNVQHRRPSRLEPRGTLHAPSILVNRWLWSVSNHIFINLLSAVYKHTRRVHLISFIYTDGFSAVSMLIAGAVMVTRNR